MALQIDPFTLPHDQWHPDYPPIARGLLAMSDIEVLLGFLGSAPRDVLDMILGHIREG